MESELRQTLIDKGYPRYKIESVLRKAQTLDACLHLLDEDTKKEEERKKIAAEKAQKQKLLELEAQTLIDEEPTEDEEEQNAEGGDEPEMKVDGEVIPPLVEDKVPSQENDEQNAEEVNKDAPVEEEPEQEPPQEEEKSPQVEEDPQVEEEPPQEEPKVPQPKYVRPEGGVHPMDMLAMQQQNQHDDEDEVEVEVEPPAETQASTPPPQEEKTPPETQDPTTDPTSPPSPTPERTARVNIQIDTKEEVTPNAYDLLTPTTQVLKNEWIRNFDVECVKLSQPVASLRSKMEDKEFEKTGTVAQILRTILKDFKEKYGIFKDFRGGQSFNYEKAETMIQEAEELLTSYDDNVRPISEVHMVRTTIKESKKLIEPIENSIVLRNVRNAALYRDQLVDKCVILEDIVDHNGGGAADAREFLEQVDKLKDRLKSEFKSELADEDIFNLSKKVNSAIKAVYKALSDENIPDARKAKNEVERLKKPLQEYSANPKASKVLAKADETIKAYDETIPVILTSLQ